MARGFARSGEHHMAKAEPMVIKVCVVLVAEVLFFSALLFGAAGTVRWPAAWAYLILFIAGAFWITLLLARRDPALLAERLKSPWQKGQPFLDKIFIVAGGPHYRGKYNAGFSLNVDRNNCGCATSRAFREVAAIIG